MEIELKFLLEPQRVEQFQRLMASSIIDANAFGSKTLQNIYYDTQEQALRQLDIGLRTRATFDDSGLGQCEQTVKLAGKDVGGLHQRPEFNVSLGEGGKDAFFANLSLFEDGIWPAGFDVERVQASLQQLFETEFSRQVWVITSPGGSKIECVLDQGQVRAAGRTTPICEIELELIEGQVADMFHYAQLIASKLPVKLGVLSKAARGYYLATDKRLDCTNLEVSRFEPQIDVETAMVTMLGQALHFIQHNELVLSETQSPKALRRIIDGISMLIHVLNLFAPHLPKSRCSSFILGFKELRRSFAWVDVFYQLQQLQNRKSPYRKDIEKSDFLRALLASQRLPDSQMVQATEKFQSAGYNRMMLNFIQWLSGKQWRNELPLTQIDILTQPLTSIAGDWLETAWGSLKMQLVKYRDKEADQAIEKLYWPLATELLTGLCVGSLYFEDNWQAFRNPLVDLLVGCEELMLLNTLDKLVAEHESDAADLEDYQSWLQGKKQSLNMALSASINNTLKLKPYW